MTSIDAQRLLGRIRDAQMMARLAPAAMIFVPSAGGISHNPREHTADAELVAGANILLDVVTRLADQEISDNG